MAVIEAMVIEAIKRVNVKSIRRASDSAGVPGMSKGYENLYPSNERESIAAAMPASPK